jgi:hypothetical protein
MQQIELATTLIDINTDNTDDYYAIIEKNNERLEIIAFEIIGMKTENQFDEFREVLFKELEIIRTINFNFYIKKRDIIKLRDLTEKMNTEMKMAIDRIRNIDHAKKLVLE